MIRFVTSAASQSDAGAGVEAGDWSIGSPNVTDLGSHESAPSALIFSATASDINGILGAASVPVTKYAASFGDVTVPEITPDKWPPRTWCHTGLSVQCSSCLFNEVELVVQAAVHQIPTPQTQTFSLGADAAHSCSHPAEITGSVEDNTAKSHGIASEIADIVITVTSADDASDVREIHSFVRSGTRAFYGGVLYIQDFQPGVYDVSVRARDAAGNWTDAEDNTSSFTVGADG